MEFTITYEERREKPLKILERERERERRVRMNDLFGGMEDC